MRIWSIHPSYLDGKGLVALWREGLLALHVLSGKTKGYRNHPQLIRFKKNPEPIIAISNYLHVVADEATRRGYSFDRTKLPPLAKSGKIIVTKGQLAYETNHLKNKLKKRDPLRHKQSGNISVFEPHPLFTVVDGDVADWEKTKSGT